MALIEGADVTYMSDSLAEIGSWVEQPVTVFALSSGTYSGTAAEAGDPVPLSFGTRSTVARIDKVDYKLLEKSAGRYMQGDVEVTMRGSTDSMDSIVWNAGTYRYVGGPWKYYIGSNLLYQGICREVKS